MRVQVSLPAPNLGVDMPTNYAGDYSKVRQEARKLAIIQVRAKFPSIIEGSSGWHRAVENRYLRILGK